MMKQLEKDLKAIAKDFKKLTQKTEKMITRLKKIEKAQAAKKAKPKAVRKAVTRKAVTRKAVTRKAVTKKAVTKKAVTKKAATRKPTKTPARDTVLAIVKSSREGLDMATLISKTGLKYNNIRTILYRLRKQGKIKSERKGLYVKA
jgi:predicted Rossmann fold nucleotide-binding protein DprA/Smf involved in DNA uptake